MLRGRYGDTTGRPYIEGRLVFPRLRLASDISFLVDTGADASVLLVADALRMGIDFTKLSGRAQSIGFGGPSNDFIEPALVMFTEPRRVLYVYEVNLRVCRPNMELLPLNSVVGRDILDRWRMTYDPSNRRLAFRVLSADLTVPLSK